MNVLFRTVLAGVMILTLSAACSRHDEPFVRFEDVTHSSGLDTYRGMTHGAAWGDFDGDGLPDLYLTNHLKDAQLFRNLGQGRFADVSTERFAKADLGGDKHGIAWADFDNDGRLDLVQLTGAVKGVGSEPKKLFLNKGDRFEDVADAAAVSNLLGRTRMPLWLDLDRDGHLDLFHGAEARFDDQTPPFLFLQRGDRFAEARDAVRFASRSVPFCIITDLNNDSQSELLCRVIGKGVTAQVFDTATLPAHELDLLPATAFEDAVAADFDNDGWIDVFLARKNPPGPIAIGRPANNELIADVWITRSDKEKLRSFSFKAASDLNYRVVSTFPSDALRAEAIHIGEKARQPAEMQFTVSSQSADTAGIAPIPADEPGVYIGRTSAHGWQVNVTAGFTAESRQASAKYQQLALRIDAGSPITEVAAADGAIHAEEAPQRLFMNRGGKLIEDGDKRGINEKPIAAMNAVAGDFDNDMDLDLFIVGSGDVGKHENMLLLNRGDGRFDAVNLAAGAAGPMAGVGDSVTTADFDGDGFLDLLVASGGSMGRSLGLASDGGAYQLYRNVGNGNHWLQIDLQGTKSNRDGIGARVEVTAGGITQVRMQDGGVHHRGQNHSRLHFGLGKNTQVERIRIIWPSGSIQEIHNAGGNKTLRIIEG